MHRSLGIVLTGVLSVGCASTPKAVDESPTSVTAGGSYNAAAVGAGTVGDVMKGDEITLSDGTHIRLIGIKAPIAAYAQRKGDFYGKGALELTKKKVEWKQVRLEYDVEPRDPRGRLLAYVYAPDGSMLQEELVRAGEAFATGFPPNVKYQQRLVAAQKEAMAARRGMWGLDVSRYPREEARDQYRIEGVRAVAVDGDTLELDDGTTLRLIGIDALESENRHQAGQVGYAAMQANKRLVEGKELVIEYDVALKDPRGRELAWVFADGKLVNEELVRGGHAIVAVFPPNVKYIDRLLKAQDEAAEARRGMWGGRQQ